MRVLVTGSAGFIGSAVFRVLGASGDVLLGIDSLNDYYDPLLKVSRLRQLGFEADHADDSSNEIVSSAHHDWRFRRLDITNAEALERIFSAFRPEVVVHLAAQAGVRYSIDQPSKYISTNVIGFYNILEACQRHGCSDLVYASSSSVYGDSEIFPLNESLATNAPCSLYAATKIADEAIASAYSNIHGIKTTGLRFFTVYGPWGRPDMAIFKFAESIANQRPIPLYANGDLSRDFTFIDDAAEAVSRVVTVFHRPNDPPPAENSHCHRIFNIGYGRPVVVKDVVAALEASLGQRAIVRNEPMQPGDVHRTWADNHAIRDATGWQPQTGINEGIRRFVEWFSEYRVRSIPSG